MALDQSAPLDLLAELKLTDGADRIRSATESLYQELIDAEMTAFIGASHLNALSTAPLSTTARGPGRCSRS